MSRKVGQIIAQDERRWLVRVYLGRDRETRKRTYHNPTIYGSLRHAQAYLTKRLHERDLSCGVEGLGSSDHSKGILGQKCLPDKLRRIKLRQNAQVEPNYLLHFLQLPYAPKTIGDLATGTSGSMKNISKEKADTIRIVLPPNERQEQLAAVVQRVDRLRDGQREADRQAEHLFLSLLHQAFSEKAESQL